MRSKLTALLFLLLISSVAMSNSPTQTMFEQNFATAAMLSSGESLSLGFVNFDPDTYVKQGGDNGESIERRNSLGIFALPYTYKLPNSKYDDRLNFSVSYMRQTAQSYVEGYQPAASDLEDETTDEFYNIYTGYARTWPLSKRWGLDTELGGFAMHHKNSHNYNSAFSQSLQPKLDGEIFNLNSNAFLLNPSVSFVYNDLHPWGNWRFENNYEYFYGWTFAGSDSSKGATPESWKIANTLKLYFTMYTGLLHAESLFLKAQRVDIGGDVVESFGTRSYYEFGGGVLLSTKKITSLIDNIGIGLNVNVGSSFTGGSLVIYFNEI